MYLELVMQHLKKSKIKLLFSIFLILTISFFIQINNNPTSKYKINNKYVEGVVESLNIKDNKTSIIVNGKEKILVNYNSKFYCKLGVKIKAIGTIEKPKENTVFHLFNYKKYLLSKKINYIFKATNIKIINYKSPLKYKIKNLIINYINKFKSKKYLKAFVLSDTKDIDDNIKESYQNNGISHLLAISGFHITILSHVLLIIFNTLIKDKKISYLLLFAFLLFYLFLTMYPPQILRAVILFILMTIKKQLEINIKTIYLLILTFLILININPYYIYSLGFILSFTVSFYLIIFNKIINKFKSYFGKTFAISIISSLAGLPIIINNFFKINLLSPIINLLFVPLISLIIYPLSLIVLLIKPIDTVLYKLIKIIEISSLKIQNINFLNITLPHINIFTIIIYYALLTSVLYIYQKKGKNYLYVFLIFLIILKNINFLNSSSSVTMIDVGQGDSLLIKLNNHKTNILIDTGGKVNFKGKSYNLSKKITVPYLKSEAVEKINYLILTHGDFDHMGEAINLVNSFKVEKVIFNCGEYNDLEKRLIKVLDKKKIKYYTCINELNIDKNKLYFLGTKEYNDENDNSNVIYTKLNGYKFIFMGDASITTEKEILSKYNLPDIDVLKVGHHGSKTSSSKEFINEINPKYSIISVGKNNRYGHPNKEVLNNLKNSKIYRTDQDGSIMFKIKNNKLKIETCSQ